MKIKITLLLVLLSFATISLAQEFGISGKPEDRLYKDAMGLVIVHANSYKHNSACQKNSFLQEIMKQLCD